MKKLALYGYQMGVENTAPIELSEITLVTTPKNLRKLAAHLLEVADTMESMGEAYDHVHLQKTTKPRPDIIVARYNQDYFQKTKLVHDTTLGAVNRIKF